jgi:hypothetical protein
MIHTFVLVILFKTYAGAVSITSTNVGPFHTPQACLAAKDAASLNKDVENAFCLQLD